MVSFGFTTTPDAPEALEEIHLRLQHEGVVRNPFKGGIFRHKPGFYTMVIKPIYPNPSPLGGLYTIAVWIFFGSGWWLLPGFILGGIGFFWTRLFFYPLLIFSMKRKGVKVKLLGEGETIRRLSIGSA